MRKDSAKRDFGSVRNIGSDSMKKKWAVITLWMLASMVLQVNAQASTYYFHNDQLGTPRVLTDSNQQVVWKGDYDAFGTVTETVALVEQNLRYPGQYFDQESGLHYNYFRTYDPETGRYVESDPIGLIGGMNTYLYGSANPQSFVDLYGLFADCITYLLGTRTEKVSRKTLQKLWSASIPIAFPVSVGVGPDIDPPKSPKNPWNYWRRRTPPVSGESGWDMVMVKYDKFVRNIYDVTKVIQTLHSFCEETITDECGNSTVHRSNKKYDRLIAEEEILVHTEKFGRWGTRKIGSATFGF